MRWETPPREESQLASGCSNQVASDPDHFHISLTVSTLKRPATCCKYGLRGKDTQNVLFLTGGEREEGGSLRELSIFGQKVSRIEGARRFPLIFVKKHRGQIGNNRNSLVIEQKNL